MRWAVVFTFSWVCLRAPSAQAGFPRDFANEQGLQEWLPSRLSRLPRGAALRAIAVGLQSSDPDVRLLALDGALQVRALELEPELWRLASEGPPELRVLALGVLALGAKGISELALRQAMASPLPLLRRAALGVLLGASSASGALPRELAERGAKDPDTQVRELAYRLLAQVSPSGDERVVALGLDDAEPSVRRAAVLALGVLGSPRAIRTVLGAADDANPTVALGAARVLTRARLPADAALQTEIEARLLSLLPTRTLEERDLWVDAIRRVTWDGDLRASLPLSAAAFRDDAALRWLMGTGAGAPLRDKLEQCVREEVIPACVSGWVKIWPDAASELERQVRRGSLARDFVLSGVDLKAASSLVPLALESVGASATETRSTARKALSSLEELAPVALEALTFALGLSGASQSEKLEIVGLLSKVAGTGAYKLLSTLESSIDPELPRRARHAVQEHALRFSDLSAAPACDLWLGGVERFDVTRLPDLVLELPRFHAAAGCGVSRYSDLSGSARTMFRQILLQVPLAQGVEASSVSRGVSFEHGLVRLIRSSSGREQIELTEVALRLGVPLRAMEGALSEVSAEVARIWVQTRSFSGATLPDNWPQLGTPSSAGLDRADPWYRALQLEYESLHGSKSSARPWVNWEMVSLKDRSAALTWGARLATLHALERGQLVAADLLSVEQASCRLITRTSAPERIIGLELLSRLGRLPACWRAAAQIVTLDANVLARQRAARLLVPFRQAHFTIARTLDAAAVYDDDASVRQAAVAETPARSPVQDFGLQTLRRLTMATPEGAPWVRVPVLVLGAYSVRLATTSSLGTLVLPDNKPFEVIPID